MNKFLEVITTICNTLLVISAKRLIGRTFGFHNNTTEALLMFTKKSILMSNI